MILEKETFEKFGYYSYNLKNFSAKKVIVACDKWGVKKERRLVNYNSSLERKRKRNQNNNYLCQSCACTTFVYKKYEVILNDLIDILYTGCIVYNHEKSRINVSSHNPRQLDVHKNLSFFDYLKLSEDCTTFELKQKTFNILIQKINWNLINYIFNNHRRLNQRSSGVYEVSDSEGYLMNFLSKIKDIEFYPFRDKRGIWQIRIKKGSFFINNEWIHIG